MNLFSSKITVVNVYRDKITKEQKYNTTTLDNCMITSKTETDLNNNSLNVENYYSVTILYTSGYKMPSEYKALPNEEMPKYWTLDTQEDLIIFGEYKEPITAYDYEKLLKRSDVGIIRSVNDNTRQDYLKHWKVILK